MNDESLWGERPAPGDAPRQSRPAPPEGPLAGAPAYDDAQATQLLTDGQQYARPPQFPLHAAGPAAQTPPMPPAAEPAYPLQPGPPPFQDASEAAPMTQQHPHLPHPPHAPAAPKQPKGGRDLRAAIGVGVGLGAVVVLSLFLVKWLFTGVVVAAVAVGVWELTSRLSESKSIEVPLLPLVVGGGAMEVSAYLGGPRAVFVAFALTCLALLVWRMAKPPEDYLQDVTAGVFTAFYVPFLASFVMLLLAAHDGPRRVVLFLVLTVCSDTGAYAVGSRFGRHKLAPRISPGKTREGLVGAVLLCMLAGALGMEFMIDKGSWWQGLVLGACVAFSATLGDLGESMIKRDLGIKDMGTLLPGHGGIMDRLDSLLPTAPIVWLVLAGFVGTHG